MLRRGAELGGAAGSTSKLEGQFDDTRDTTGIVSFGMAFQSARRRHDTGKGAPHAGPPVCIPAAFPQICEEATLVPRYSLSHYRIHSSSIE